MCTDRDEAGGRETLAQLSAAGGKGTFRKHDAAAEADWQRVVADTVREYGRVDVLVNNAGVGMNKATVDTTLADWDLLNSINARGTFLGCREVIAPMQKAGGGSIINVSSTYALAGRAGFAAYGASKGAVRAMSRALAAELAEFNIRVNAVFPGTIETNLTKPVLSTPAMVTAVIGPQLIRRPGQPLEVATAVLYLASEESSFVTGSELVVDGGYVAV